MAFNGFTIFILAIIGAVAFFHYTQGFFSATISVVICVLAAVLAVSYHEQVAPLLMGMMPNTAHPVALLLMFAIIYLVLRTVIDSMVPGNVTLPAVLDKAGAAVMGLVAGVFAAGLVALAAQEMPVGPSVLGYARFAVDDRETSVPVQPRSLDRGLYSMLTQPTLDPKNGGEPQKLVVPVDDILLNTVQSLSEGGSLASGKELTTVHPAWLTELFGQRLGIEPGGKRVALPEDGTLLGLYTLPSVAQRDHEFKGFLRGWPGTGLAPTFPAAPTSQPSAAAEGGARTAAAKAEPAARQELVIARVVFKRSAADKDRFIRFSPGSIRLVARKVSGGNVEWVNYLPIGTYDPNTRILWRNRPDDFLFLNEGAEPPGDKAADIVFYIDKTAYAEDSKDPKASRRFAPGSFLEIKRQLRFDLDGQEVLAGTAALTKFPARPEIQVLRKPNVVKPPDNSWDQPAPIVAPTPAPAPAPGTPAPGTPAPGTPAPGTPATPAPATPQTSSLVNVTDVKQNSRFFTGINVPPTRGGPFSQIPGGIAAVQNKKLTSLQLTPIDVTRIRGDVIEMFVPEGQAMVQVEATPSKVPAEAWAWWTQVGDIGLKDDKGTVHKLVGAWTSVELQGATHVTGAFQSDPANALLMPQMSQPQAPPSKMWFAAYVPKGAKIKEVVIGNQVLKSGLDLGVQ